ncbi:MAG TPA: hypothetical protein VGI39_32370 [Polyangiaceae bacterium]|jgi:hypothetical protein
MGHELKPRNGRLPPATEVADRLAKEFAYVRTDAEEGTKQAHSRAEWIERAPARVFLGRHKEALEGAARLKSLAPGEALAIEFGDDSKKTKQIVVIPGEPINFGYASKEDEAASKSLVERCARALDCEVVLF